MTELINTVDTDVKINLKQLTDIIDVRHDRAKKKVEELMLQDDFGTVSEIDIVYNDRGQTTKTYILNEKQAIAVGAKLNDGLLMKLINEIEKLKRQQSKPLTFEEMAKQTILLADKKIKQLETKIEEDKPLVDFANTIAQTSESILVRDFCKLLGDEGIDIGQNKLYKWFRDNGYLMKNNQPYQHALKYFSVSERLVRSVKGDILTSTTYINGAGQIFFLKKLNKIVQ